MEKFDVIVVGAGPGGLNCANHLANFGKSVLILEKNEIIGKKVCAGGLTQKAYDYLQLPEKLIQHKFKEVNFNTLFIKSKIKSKDYFIYTIDRIKLAEWQVKQLKNNLVKIRKKSRVTSIGEDYIIVNNKEKIKFNFLVGADGSSSIVRKYLGLETKNFNIAVQYIIPNNQYKEFEVFFNSRLFYSWYAWIFPHNNYVSIGCGCNPKILSAKKLIENFHKWLNKMNIDYSSGEFQSHPINYDFQGLKFNSTFLVGDAAGLASAFTGEGIYQALVSGEEAARMINDKKYKSDKLDDLLKYKKKHNKVLCLLNKSGFLRNFEYVLVGLLLKTNLIDKKVINIFG